MTSFAQACEAMDCRVDWVLLDNMSTAEMRRVVEVRNHTSEFEVIEASRNVTLKNVRSVALCGIDAISVGALTHSPSALDVSLLVSPDPAPDGRSARTRWVR